MARNEMSVMVKMDSSQLTKGAKDASKSVQGFGAEVKKTENTVKSIKKEIGAQQAELNKLTNAYRIAKNELGQNAARTLDLKAKMDQTVQSLARLKAEEQQVATAVKTATAQITAQGNAAQVTSAKINTMGGGVTALGGKFRGLSGMLSSAAGMMGGSLGTVTSSLSSMGGMMSMVGAESGAAAAGIGAAGAATGGVVIAAAAAGLAFKKVYDNTMEWRGALNQLKNNLGITQEQTKAFGDSALELSNKFGRSATEIVGAFKAFADSSPGLENNQKALEQVTSSALKLSIALGTDLESSVTTLDTVMSQFNAKASESEHYINVLAAATQNGASDLAYLNDYFSKVGTTAAQANIPVEQMAAAANLLSQKAFDSSKAGAQMSMIIKKLSTQANSEFNPAIVGLDTAFQNLANANLNATQVSELFGKKGQEAGIILMDNIEKLKETAEKYKNAQTAQELFGIQSEKLGEIVNRIKETWDNFMTKLGESAAFNAVLDIIKDIMTWFEELGKKIDEAFDSDATSGYASMLEGIWDALKPILDIIGDIIVVMIKVYNWIYKIIGFVAKLVAAWIKGWIKIKDKVLEFVNKARKWWSDLQKKLMESKAFNWIVKAFNWVRDKFKAVINKLSEWWNKFINFFIDAWNGAMELIEKTGVDMSPYKIQRKGGGKPELSGGDDGATLGDGNTTTTTEVKDKPNGNGGGGNGSGGSGGRHGSSKPSKPSKPGKPEERQAAAGSIAALEAEKQKLENDLKNGWSTNIEADKKRIKELKDQIEDLQVALGFSDPKAVEGSLEYMEKELSDLQDKVKKGLIPYDDIEKTNAQIKQMQKDIQAKKIQLGLELAPETDYEKTEEQRLQFLDEYKQKLRHITDYAANDDIYQQNIEAIKAYEKEREEAAENWAENIGEVSEETKKREEEQKKALAELTEQYEKGLITIEQYDEAQSKLGGTLDEVFVAAPKPLKAPIEIDLGNIPKQYNDAISEIDKMLSEDDISAEMRIRLLDTKQQLQRKVDDITKGKLSIPAVIEPEFVVTGSTQDLRESYANASNAISKIQSDYEQGIIKTAKERNDMINEWQRKLTALGLKPIEIELKTKGMEKIEEIQGKMSQFQTLMSSMDGVKNFISSITEGADAFTIFTNAISAAMSVLQTIEQIMGIFNTIQQTANQLTQESATAKEADAAATAGQTAANAGEAASNIAVAGSEGAKAAGKAASQNSGMGPFGWIAGIAAALAIAGAIFGIISQAKGFAGGGIVDGKSTVGDHLYARLNGGEAILNNRQQQRMMNILNGAPVHNDYGPVNTEIKVRGSDIYLALSNYSKGKKLVGKNTGIK